jgi:hypothetical protein
MVRTWMRSGMVTAAVVAAVLWVGGVRTAGAVERHISPDLFYNYYVPPCNCGDPGAALYLSPVPTPPYVGHTYITYQPLMPHEFLYPHSRTYVTKHVGSPATRTRVRWN